VLNLVQGGWMDMKQRTWAVFLAAAAAVLSSSCRGHYENPITTPTEQPDKVLFDKAIDALEHNRYDSARLLLNTLINTYDSSEFLAKAKLAIADSWYREGGAHGLSEAEIEYKDFILFYPAMEEAAEAQERVCHIHYDQMGKADRDPVHAIRAEEECHAVLTQYPNSKYAPEAEQLLRNIQENRAMGEYMVGKFYMTKGNSLAAGNRLAALSDQFPLFSKADDAAWLAYESYDHFGDRYEKQKIDALSTLVREYPLSSRVDAAKEMLQEMNAPVPDADPAAEARMKYEQQNRGRISLWSAFWGGFAFQPNLALAAKSGAPSMQPFQPTTPVSVPSAASAVAPRGEVTIATPTNPGALESAPDARTGAASGAGNPTAGGAAAPAAGAAPAPAPSGQAAAPGSASPPAAGQATAPAPGKGQTKAAKPAKQPKARKPPKPPKPVRNAKSPAAPPASNAPQAPGGSPPAPAAPPPQQP
jgi:outer membrane protein assembly factor BamD